MGKYDTIISLPYNGVKKHTKMTLEERSAQFAPFAALTGYDGQIKEKARLTNKRIEISEDIKTLLDTKIQIICENISNNLKVEITYFVPDNKKDGGEYVSVIGTVREIDNFNRVIVMENNIRIPIYEIIDINSEIFNNIF